MSTHFCSAAWSAGVCGCILIATSYASNAGEKRCIKKLPNASVIFIRGQQKCMW